MEPAAQETLHEVTPTVELCLSELSYEVERCFAELGSEAWDLNPVQFLAMALKRHNPRRGKAALTIATAAAETDVYVKPRRSAPGGGDTADSRMMRPAVVLPSTDKAMVPGVTPSPSTATVTVSSAEQQSGDFLEKDVGTSIT